jgi:hypothetical protein
MKSSRSKAGKPTTTLQTKNITKKTAWRNPLPEKATRSINIKTKSILPSHLPHSKPHLTSCIKPLAPYISIFPIAFSNM